MDENASAPIFLIDDGSTDKTGEICKDELSYRFVTVKRRNHFKTYKCNCCKKEVHQNIPNHLKEDNQYGSEIQAVALSLANEGNVSMNKIRHIIYGFSHEDNCQIVCVNTNK